MCIHSSSSESDSLSDPSVGVFPGGVFMVSQSRTAGGANRQSLGE